ncbi:MAG: hypothetical protein SVP26_07700 [Chloroflexota bacterium]|nr:hypothetical protein [Chloroflexota bacterium]
MTPGVAGPLSPQADPGQGANVALLVCGLPFGADLEYADEVTLTRALQERHEM